MASLYLERKVGARNGRYSTPKPSSIIPRPLQKPHHTRFFPFKKSFCLYELIGVIPDGLICTNIGKIEIDDLHSIGHSGVIEPGKLYCARTLQSITPWPSATITQLPLTLAAKK